MRLAWVRSRLLVCCVVVCASSPARARAQEAESTPADVVREHRERELRSALVAVQREQAETTRLVPLLVLGTGIAIAATGLIAGAGAALACDDSCSGPFWPGWLVLGGATVGTGGGLWLVLKNREIAELRSRRHHIETELQYLEWSAQAPAPSGAGLARGTGLGLTLAF